jgi:hypothetical protein
MYTINETHKQYCSLGTIFNYIFYLGPPGGYLYLSPQIYYMSAGRLFFLQMLLSAHGLASWSCEVLVFDADRESTTSPIQRNKK